MKNFLRCFKACKVNVMLLCVAVFSLAFSQHAKGQNVNATWNAGGSAWYTGSNWVGGVYPGHARGGCFQYQYWHIYKFGYGHNVWDQYEYGEP